MSATRYAVCPHAQFLLVKSQILKLQVVTLISVLAQQNTLKYYLGLINHWGYVLSRPRLAPGLLHYL